MVKRKEEPDSQEEGEGTQGAWAQGLSKGVYVHKVSSRGTKRPARSPMKGRPRKRGRSEDAEGGAEGALLLADCFASRSGVRVEERVESYSSLVEEVEGRVRALQEEVFTGVFESLVAHVEVTGRGGGALGTIPTAVLLTGVNMPDHTQLFSLLISKLEVVTPHVCLVGPGLSFRSLVTQLVMELSLQDGEAAIKKSDASMAALAAWYQAKYPAPSPRPPLVIILQQFEGTAGPALQDLIVLLSRHPLPWVLVLGVATTLATVHKALSQAATSKLTIHSFGSPAATLCLDQVVEAVLVNPDIPFKLDYRVFQFLIENFLYHDFAIRHFMEGYKFILGEHFYRSPASLLCCSPEQAARRLASLDNTQLDCIRRLPSVRRYTESLPLEQQAALLTCPTTCRQVVSGLLAELQEQVAVFTCLTRALGHLAQDLPRRPLGKTLRVTYELCLAGQVTSSHQFKEAWRYLQLSNRGELERKVSLVLEELSCLAPSSPLASLTSQLTSLHTRLVEMGEAGEEASSVPPSPAIASLASRMNTPLATPLPSLPSSLAATPSVSAASSPAPGAPLKLDRFNLKQSLQALKDGQRKASVLRPYDILRAEIVSLLLAALQEHLVPPSSLPLHEVTTFTSLAAVKRHLVGAPRAALHTALTQPGEYLEHPSLAIEDPGEIPPAFPDLAIGYKLHLECPRLINVFDWLTCWNSIVTGEEDETVEIPPKQQARFARVVAQLQMLGFIKTSNKKTDHVARLTFGGS